ncbi:MAG: DUF123 domain-containing protein [Halodesulfurarchaeum sp.]
MATGIYTLLVELPESRAITFGAAGLRDLEGGWYAYTGSALGPGGFQRIERHLELARGERDTRHWHVDYLLGAEISKVAGVWTSEGRTAECEIARSLAGEPIAGLGASDCSCVSHLHYERHRSPLEDSIASSHR